MFHQLPLDLSDATVYWMQPLLFKAWCGQACVPTHSHISQRQISEIMVPRHMALFVVSISLTSEAVLLLYLK